MENEKYSNYPLSISAILGLIEANDIAIPEIQRPFVWKKTQVRDLIDSLYKGYPTGYIILELIPIEVKAENNVNGKSFAEYNKKYEPRIRLRFSMLNIKRNGNLVNFPIFLCDWLSDVISII